MIISLTDRVRESVRNFLPDYIAVNLLYYCVFRRLPDLKHPKTFNEKIAWRKLYQRDPRFQVFSDKIAVKAEIARLIGEPRIIETLWTGDAPEAIPFDELAPPYVVKANHSTGGSLFIRTPQDVKREMIVSSMRKQIGLSHGRRFREWGYLGIQPRVLIERMVETPNGDLPEDYKFFVYHGRAHFIQFVSGRPGGLKLNFYDREWNLLPAKLRYPCTSQPIPKPANLAQMIEIAEKIGAQFDFVRVDLYSSPQGILFGEVTFYPNAGLEAFTPEQWDMTFGEPWHL
jgi:hypothetical protein